jgi:putative phosphoesterase
MRVGILADTHGLLRPRVLERLAGCDRLLHAGDVVDLEILARLREIAPVTAVQGNMDAPNPLLPPFVTGTLEEVPFGMIHRREDIPSFWPREMGLIVFGHSHRPELEWRGSCLLLNPGACGGRRFSLPLTVAVVTVVEKRIVPEILAVE